MVGQHAQEFTPSDTSKVNSPEYYVVPVTSTLATIETINLSEDYDYYQGFSLPTGDDNFR